MKGDNHEEIENHDLRHISSHSLVGFSPPLSLDGNSLMRIGAKTAESAVQKLKLLWERVKPVKVPMVSQPKPPVLGPMAPRTSTLIVSGASGSVFYKLWLKMKSVSTFRWVKAGCCLLLKYIKSMITEALRSFGFIKAGFLFVGISCGAYSMYRVWNLEKNHVQLAFIGQALLIVAYDVFAHDQSRRSLMKLSENGDFQVIVPIAGE